jgi:hypothetical protein
VGLLAAESLLWPLAPDQGIYAWISDVIRDGGLPYADAWDIKGPSTFYTVALAQLVLGRHPWSIRVVDVVLLAITCGGLALLAPSGSSRAISGAASPPSGSCSW